MKWTEVLSGTTRTKTKFLWFPVTIGVETRWLERVTVLQTFRRIPHRCRGYGWYGWDNDRWVDKESCVPKEVVEQIADLKGKLNQEQQLRCALDIQFTQEKAIRVEYQSLTYAAMIAVDSILHLRVNGKIGCHKENFVDKLKEVVAEVRRLRHEEV